MGEESYLRFPTFDNWGNKFPAKFKNGLVVLQVDFE